MGVLDGGGSYFSLFFVEILGAGDYEFIFVVVVTLRNVDHIVGDKQNIRRREEGSWHLALKDRWMHHQDPDIYPADSDSRIVCRRFI